MERRGRASEYGRTGSPGGPPPSRVPHQSEQLTNLFGSDSQAAHRIRAMVQAHESLEALASGGPLFTLGAYNRSA
ncbi:hypothetical protein [Cystobacter ferrugineus]|uniref:Uncharacterized protein n=1 Tax=Cystobacter ferrugineus TaxID=83449 RepID=A0A1L9BDA1_9BACT|nr:hypothetical protein [Cystobacter ferrugineus]OJH40231.1 hypothetical protein BON30_14395 [Cystobacter ferrugineus]